MKNEIIIILLIIIFVVGSILYFYKDTLKDKFNKTSDKLKKTVSHAAKQVKEDIKK